MHRDSDQYKAVQMLRSGYYFARVYYLTILDFTNFFIWIIISYFRDTRNNRVALFDGIEEGGIRASSMYSSGSSHEIDEHDNEQAMDGLQDRVNLLKRVSLVVYCYL